MNLKKLLVVFFLVASSLTLRAQTGCDDSPEDPTVVLALLGGASAAAAWAWRRLRR